ncbi:hypothetical protein QLH52_03070 [Methylomonas sp. OY6]|uniref:Uncharacterized protein n=1 Tax=Methylomonas defluvii TaxID=3045149 RepID=A0ABU4U9W8_9GAMM|nr:hypothetical protein [Methylomonas sp. OY6]MDX8126247.1 hypothetical protein [Methylomonas sp. OY6]
MAFASYRLIENSINMARQSIFKGIMTKWQQPLLVSHKSRGMALAYIRCQTSFSLFLKKSILTIATKWSSLPENKY